ncbi:unnamed protein product [marine sediment metagenome]|uniref:Uncharacterized protein n=1 Tax=marine sediment metagenome TaxID=412755 RepID=X1VAJ8_9ZZZZ
MSLRLGIMIIQLCVGFGAFSTGLYFGGMKELWWLAVIGAPLYFFGMVLPLALTQGKAKRKNEGASK